MQWQNKKETIERIGKNLQYYIQKKGVSQGKLIKQIQEKRGYSISQPYLSRIIQGKLDHIPAVPLVTICEALEIDIQKVFWDNINTEDIIESEASIEDSKIVFCAKDGEFEKYLGLYHCYFYPTISSESEVLHGILNFELDKHTRECRADFTLFTTSENGEPVEKKYVGRLILSSSYNCCYCYLLNEVFGEMSFLMFKGLSANTRKLSCRMAAVLTPSAGGTRDATCHRMFLSKKKLSDVGVSVVAPHLKINTAEIYITEEHLREFFQEMNVPSKFQNVITCLTEPENFYVLREEHFWGFGNKQMDGYDKNLFITQLRKKSNAPNYHKIGKKVDDMLYKYMYKAKEKEKFFDEK